MVLANELEAATLGDGLTPARLGATVVVVKHGADPAEVRLADGTTRTARGDALAPRPALRGWFHAVSFPVMATLGLVLVLASDVSLHGRVLLATYVGGVSPTGIQTYTASGGVYGFHHG